jgi:ABC-2 type transport system permease protein
MTALGILLAHSLRRVRGLLGGMAIVLAGFQVLLVLGARSIAGSGAFEQIAALIPPIVRQAVGPAVLAIMSFGGLVSVGYFHVAVVAAFVMLALVLGTEVALEAESGLADLLLARPVPRRTLVTRSAILVTGLPAAIVLAMLGASHLALAWLTPAGAAPPPPGGLPALALGLWSLAGCWGGLALAAGSLSRRRSVPLGVLGLTALVLYLADYIGRLWSPAEHVAWLSPFRYFKPTEIIRLGRVETGDLAVLWGLAAAGIGVAYVIFRRRDV